MLSWVDLAIDFRGMRGGCNFISDTLIKEQTTMGRKPLVNGVLMHIATLK